ncbi:hypothetical protein B0H16DRAFT_1477349 [Mycena metata]|uniref:Uncharacterized protein n=1 Tax=Mycena metata TaxID=1033252 RepID=A0AAD7H937_9AGAR|nr:hypothetical protein B0H16DRAFT_1477349 [Mycena metata]
MYTETLEQLQQDYLASLSSRLVHHISLFPSFSLLINLKKLENPMKAQSQLNGDPGRSDHRRPRPVGWKIQHPRDPREDFPGKPETGFCTQLLILPNPWRENIRTCQTTEDSMGKSTAQRHSSAKAEQSPSQGTTCGFLSEVKVGVSLCFHNLSNHTIKIVIGNFVLPPSFNPSALICHNLKSSHWLNHRRKREGVLYNLHTIELSERLRGKKERWDRSRAVSAGYNLKSSHWSNHPRSGNVIAKKNDPDGRETNHKVPHLRPGYSRPDGCLNSDVRASYTPNASDKTLTVKTSAAAHLRDAVQLNDLLLFFCAQQRNNNQRKTINTLEKDRWQGLGCTVAVARASGCDISTYCTSSRSIEIQVTKIWADEDSAIGESNNLTLTQNFIDDILQLENMMLGGNVDLEE